MSYHTNLFSPQPFLPLLIPFLHHLLLSSSSPSSRHLALTGTAMHPEGETQQGESTKPPPDLKRPGSDSRLRGLSLRQSVWVCEEHPFDVASALKPLTCSIRICLTIVLFPDSPAPNSSSRWVARYICLSFWSCFSIFLLASLCCFSSFRWSSVLLLPRQPIFPKTQRQVQGGGRVVDWLVGWL